LFSFPSSGSLINNSIAKQAVDGKGKLIALRDKMRPLRLVIFPLSCYNHHEKNLFLAGRAAGNLRAFR